MTETCFVCGDTVEDRRRRVLVRGRRHLACCSNTCLRAAVDRRRVARALLRRRAALTLGAMALALFAAGSTWRWWRRHQAPARESISVAWPEALPPPDAPPLPRVFGPPWPPTDEEWSALLREASGIYPLPGPLRRAPAVDRRIWGPEPPRDRPARCREADHCGVDLGGELWGEHVYAALDGVVERVQGDGNDLHGGRYVRLSHLGGMVFTQYFHLAATPRGLVHGARVRAGEVIGLLGDTGLDEPRRHLAFTLSIRPSGDFPEVYWDPMPWMARWPLRMPAHGTVAGLARR